MDKLKLTGRNTGLSLGILTEGEGRLSTVYLLFKVACFVTKVNNIFNIKAADLN
jgi:hypothetical protein